MPSILLEYRLRIRNAANTADAITFTSVRGDTAPYIEGPPTCDGQEINPLTGDFRSGTYTGVIVDSITSGTSRAVTSQLEDANFRQQLSGRLAFWDLRTNGGAWIVLGAGYLTLLRLVDGARWEVTVSDATRVEDNALAFAPKKGVLALTANAALAATSLTVSALPFAIANGFKLYFLSGKQAVVTAAAASGATSVSVAALAAALTSGDSAPITESFASYFARWPQRGCVFGGPVSGGFLSVPDLCGWNVKASATVTGVDTGNLEGGSGSSTWLEFVQGYVPPTLQPTQKIGQVADVVNNAVSGLRAVFPMTIPTFPTDIHASFWPGLVYQIVALGSAFSGAASEFYAPEDAYGFPNTSMNGKGTLGIVDVKNNRKGLFIVGTGLPGGTLRIRGLTMMPSDISPIYWTGHPIDLAKALLDEQLRTYDATSAETVRQAIGADRRISLRITQLPKVNDILRNAVYAPFGIGVRVNTSGILEFFVTRILSNSPPTTTITDADIRHDASGGTGIQSWFELDESTAVRTVTFEYDAFFLIQQADKYPPDGVGIQHITIQLDNGDPGAVGQGVAAFSVPGMVHAKDALLQRYVPQAADDTVRTWVNQLGYEIFNRWGRGVVAGELPFLRGGAGDTLKLGDECINRIPQLPNKNKRYGDDNTVGGRAMQVVRLTQTPVGALVKLIDSGPNANPVATLPTLTLAAASQPRLSLRVPKLTVTNAATLDASSIGIEIQMAVTTGATPASTDYVAAGAFGYGAIPTTAIQLGWVTNGRTVWVRARSTQIGARPSAWTTPISLALTALNPVTSLAATINAGDGTQTLVTWTPGANADQSAIDVYVRVSTAPAATAVRVAVLDASSAQYNVEGLIPNTSYTVGVQARDENYGDTSVMVEVTFTTANVTPVLTAPLYPQWFAGSIAPPTGLPSRIAALLSGVARTDGSYGMAVFAAVFPSFVEFFEAVETSVGSGTYGSFNSVGKVASVQGDWTRIDRTAPNDKLRRQLKAQHVKDNATASAFTAIGTVTPWGTPVRLALPPLTRSVPTADDGYYAGMADSSGQVYLQGAGTSSTQKVNVGTPTTPASMHRIYRIPFTAFTPSDTANGADKTHNDIRPKVTGTTIDFLAPVILPQGSTIVAMAVHGFRNAVGDFLTVTLNRTIDGTLTGIASVSVAASAAWVTGSSSSLSEAVNTSYMYFVDSAHISTVAAGDTRLGYVEITVTVPDLNTGL